MIITAMRSDQRRCVWLYCNMADKCNFKGRNKKCIYSSKFSRPYILPCRIVQANGIQKIVFRKKDKNNKV
jgi:hypothetical protein